MNNRSVILKECLTHTEFRNDNKSFQILGHSRFRENLLKNHEKISDTIEFYEKLNIDPEKGPSKENCNFQSTGELTRENQNNFQIQQPKMLKNRSTACLKILPALLGKEISLKK